MAHFVCLFVDFEWESSSTFSISVSKRNDFSVQICRLFQHILCLNLDYTSPELARGNFHPFFSLGNLNVFSTKNFARKVYKNFVVRDLIRASTGCFKSSFRFKVVYFLNKSIVC